MNNYNTIGNIIYILRTNMEISQEQLANISNVSRTVIAKIESGKRNPTEEQLTILSSKLNFDLLSYKDKIHNYKSFEHYLLASELTKLIKTHSIFEISEIIDNNPIFLELDYGQPKILKIYCETIVLITLKKNIDKAFKSCLKFFEIKKLNISNFYPKIGMPEQYYSMILNLGYCLSVKKDFNNSLILYNNTISFLENTYFNKNLPFINIDSFYSKYYIICLNNISDTYFIMKYFTDALSYCNKGIEYSAELNVLIVLPQLTKLKVEILYNLNRIDESKEAYWDFKSICRLSNNFNYFEQVSELFKTTYREIFN